MFARADEVAAGRFRFLNLARDLGPSPFPAPADAPLLWAYHLEYMDYLLDLGLADHPETVAALVQSRLRAEPRTGRSGTHPYPESRRAASFVRAIPRADGETRDRLARGAWFWANRIASNLEHDVGGNHLLENGLALVLAGAAFRGRRARELLARGRRILLAGAAGQVQGDGAHFELSAMYHARVMSVLAEGGLAMEAAGAPAPAEYWEAVGRMVAFLGGVLAPDGRIPLLGDAVHEETTEPDLLIEAVERRLPFRLRRAAGGDREYPDAGFIVFEDRPAGHRLILDAGPTCPDRLPAHAHADTFTMELHGAGVPLIVDTGVNEYADGGMRAYCRSTRAHSTVTVDGEDSSEVWSSFRAGRRARIWGGRFAVRDGMGTWSGRHDGYRHLGVAHTRLVSHLEEGLWLVLDGMRGRGAHSYASRIHLHPAVVAERRGGGVLVHRGEVSLAVIPFGPCRHRWEEGWYCPELGVRRRRQVMTFDAEGEAVLMGYALAIGPGAAPDVLVDGRTARVRYRGREHARALP